VTFASLGTSDIWLTAGHSHGPGAGGGAALFHSADAGSHWIRVGTPTDPSVPVTAVAYFTQLNAIGVDFGRRLMRSPDGGAHWIGVDNAVPAGDTYATFSSPVSWTLADGGVRVSAVDLQGRVVAFVDSTKNCGATWVSSSPISDGGLSSTGAGRPVISALTTPTTWS